MAISHKCVEATSGSVKIADQVHRKMGELEPVTRTGKIIHSRDKHLLSCGFDIVFNRHNTSRWLLLKTFGLDKELTPSGAGTSK